MSREHKMTVDFLETKKSTVFRTEKIAEVHPVPFLKPNCLSDVLRYGEKINIKHFSNTLEITGVREMPLYPSTVARDLPAFGTGTKVLIPKAPGTTSSKIKQLNNFVNKDAKMGWACLMCSPDKESAPGDIPPFSISIDLSICS